MLINHNNHKVIIMTLWFFQRSRKYLNIQEVIKLLNEEHVTVSSFYKRTRIITSYWEIFDYF